MLATTPSTTAGYAILPIRYHTPCHDIFLSSKLYLYVEIERAVRGGSVSVANLKRSKWGMTLSCDTGLMG